MRTAPTRRLASFAAASVALVLLAACSGGGDDDKDSAPSHTGREGDGWTVLHYSMADTNLEPFMVTDVNELGEVGSNENLTIREFMDRSAGYGEDPLLDQGDWVGGRVLDLGEPGTAEVVEDLGDVNSADPAMLATFISQGIEAHRAGHYALIISDHGASWPGIGPDEGTEDYDVLDLAEITEAIAAGLEDAGVDKLDLLGFDACLMANYEVASAVAPYADRLVASQELEPGHGWDYRSLQLLADDPKATVDEFGRALIDGFEAQAVESGTEDEITLSMVDLTKMGAVDKAVEAFADTLSSESGDVAAAVGRSNATTLGFGKSPDETQDSHLRDLGLLAAAIGESAPDVADRADAVVSALEDAVVDSVDGVVTQGATGLSIYLPPVPDLADPAYADVSSDWAEFLDSYYETGADLAEEEQARFTDSDDGPLVELDDDGSITLTGVFDEGGLGNITEATIGYAFIDDDGTLTYFGEEIAEFDVDDDGVPTAVGSYDLTALEITDGEDSAIAYVQLDLSDDLKTAYFDVPLTYYSSTDPETPRDALLSLVLNINAGKFKSETIYIYDEKSGGYGELAPDPEGVIVPDVLTVTPDGEQSWDPTSEVGLYADIPNLNYEFVPLESGVELLVDLTIYDFGGNSSTVNTFLEVP